MRGRTLAWAITVAAVASVTRDGRGEDRATVRGSYYRERSTKVVQPMVLVTKDLPHGVDVAAHGLVDAITSPSILTGVPSDEIFTEYRKEVGVGVGKTIGHSRVALAYRESREPDYISHAVGLSLEQGVWQNTGTVSLALAYSDDTIGPFLSHSLRVGFASLFYTQALSPVTLVQVGYEVAYLEGFQCNVYARDALGPDRCPRSRLRHVWVGRMAHYVPSLSGGLQLHYRFYYDHWPWSTPNPWGMQAHTLEARLHRELGRAFELRLGYRYHTQGTARFRWCGSNPALGPTPECVGIYPAAHSGDEKFGPLTTHVAELKLYWEARALATVPLLAWFAGGAFELSYGRYFQETHYGDAHILQTGYSLPF